MKAQNCMRFMPMMTVCKHLTTTVLTCIFSKTQVKCKVLNMLWRYSTDDTGAVTFHSDFIHLQTTPGHMAPKNSRTPPLDLGVSGVP